MDTEEAPAKSIALNALEIVSPQERQAYVEAQCGDDLLLRGDVEGLLHHHAALGGFLDCPASDLAATLDLPLFAERPGASIGRYKLLQEIGEGGMGVVYMAEQREPVRRKVALKIIKPGMDTRTVVARFESERQALALMDHPNIAHVFDAGTTDESSRQTPCAVAVDGTRNVPTTLGRPYFVMELVQGLPLTEYCDQNDLTTRERLELFVQVCHAVQHAHQKGIIHRDLKPSNVMVTLYDGLPVPKIIDFGVAKATGGQLTDKTALTGCGQIIGTPLYMSPEQAEMSALDVDTRSDIYSLGVLLYELLTGSTPFDRERIREAGYDEIRRMIREEEPPRPSARISTLGAAATTISVHRKTDPAKLSRMFRRELDWIVMKALEKDRTQRYQTASDFARDIERYLSDEPIEARPPTPAGRAARWARRHRPLVWASTAVLGVLLVASLASALLIAGAYEREKMERVVAETNEARALTGENLAKRQEELARQQEALAKAQQKLAIQQKAEAERQRDVAENALYAANMQVARQDWMAGQAHRLEHLLDAQLPKPGRPDFRGWEWYYLFSLCHAERLALPCQYTFGWSPDGKHLATADYVGSVNIWDVPSGERKALLQGCPPQPHCICICWSPDGERVAASTDRGMVMIWEVASGIKLPSLMGRGAAVSLIEWSPDGRWLATGDDQGTISIWDWRAGRTRSSLVVPAGPLHSLDWHPDGRQLVTVYGRSRDVRELKIWDTDSGREIAGWPAGGGVAAAFSPDGSRLLWGINPVRVTDLESRKVVSSFPALEAFRSTWNPSGDRVASTAGGGTIRIWDAASGAELQSIQAHLRQTMPIAWSPKGELLAAMSYDDGTVRVWDTGAARKDMAFDAPCLYSRWVGIAFSPDGKRLLVGPQFQSLKIHDVESGEVTLSGQHVLGWLRRVDWSPDGKRFAINTYVDPPGWIVLICDARTGEAVLPPVRCEREPRSLAWSPDGRVLAVGLVSGAVKLFSAGTGKELAVSACAAGSCEAVAWSPDGKRLLAAGNPFRVWDSVLHPQSFAATTSCFCVDWSPDGRRLVAGSKDGTITIYDATAGTLLHVLEANGDVDAVHWHPSMPRLASGGRDGMIHIWDTSTGQELCALPAHKGMCRDLDWSPDGWRLATAGEDGSVPIWDASPADQFFKRHGDLRAKVWKLVAPYYASQRKVATKQEFQEALDLLRQLRTLHPEEKDLEWQIQHVEWLRATQLARAGQTGEAIAIFRQLTAQSPDLPDYRLQLPGVLFDAGRETQAIEMLEKTVAEFPQQPEYHEELAFLYERRAIQLCQAGELPNAVPFLQKLASEFPERPGHRSQLVRQLTAQLPQEKAMKVFQGLVQEFPDAGEYRRALARRLEESGQRDQAITELSEAIRIDPRNVDGYCSRANLYQATGDFEKALADFAKAIELEPENPDRWLSRAVIYVQQGKWDSAIAALSRAAQLKPGDTVARTCHDLAQTLQKTGQTNEAEQAYLQAIDIWEKLGTDQPDKRDYRQHTAYARGFLANLLFAAKRTKEAEETYRQSQADFEKLLADFPGEPACRTGLAHREWGLGNLLKVTGRPKEAEESYRHALGLFEKLVADYPAEAFYRQELAVSYCQLASLLEDAGRSEEAEKLYHEARLVLEKLVAENNAADYRYRLANCEKDLGTLLQRTGQIQEAEKVWRKAIAGYEKLVADVPQEPAYQNSLAALASKLGDLLKRASKPKEPKESREANKNAKP